MKQHNTSDEAICFCHPVCNQLQLYHGLNIVSLMVKCTTVVKPFQAMTLVRSGELWLL